MLVMPAFNVTEGLSWVLTRRDTRTPSSWRQLPTFSSNDFFPNSLTRYHWNQKVKRIKSHIVKSWRSKEGHESLFSDVTSMLSQQQHDIDWHFAKMYAEAIMMTCLQSGLDGTTLSVFPLMVITIITIFITGSCCQHRHYKLHSKSSSDDRRAEVQKEFLSGPSLSSHHHYMHSDSRNMQPFFTRN